MKGWDIMKKSSFVLIIAVTLLFSALLYGCSDTSEKQQSADEISKNGKQTGISKYITAENGEYTLTLPTSKKTLELSDSEDNFVTYISDALVESAEEKITEDAAKYSDSPHFYLTVKDDGELYLAAEVIYYLDEPDENEGCYDHKHLFFSERISNRTGK